jgi:hypothetical protein
MPFVALKIALLSWKLSVSVFQHRTYVISPRSFAPSAKCVSAANAVCKSIDIFRKSCWSLNRLSWFIIFVFLFFTLLFCPVLSYFLVVMCWLCNWPLAVEFSTLINKELNWIIAIATRHSRLHSHQSDAP